MSTADEIKKLNDLLKEGVLTQEEYDSQKNKLLKSDSQSQNQWIVVLLLAFFLGFIGAHRFYVGKNGTGILMILTVGGIGLWVLYDLIIIITGNFKTKQGNKVSFN
jgi:TM2 domain-containing membrane protein YozV